MNKIGRSQFLLTAGAVLGLPAIADAGVLVVRPLRVSPDTSKNLAQKIASIPDLSTLSGLIQGNSTVLSELQGTGPYTVFAPSNEAFTKLSPATYRRIQSDMTLQTNLLNYHILSGSYLEQQLMNGSYATLQGDNVDVRHVQLQVYVNHSRITMPDLRATNGVIHVIDKVLTAHLKSFG